MRDIIIRLYRQRNVDIDVSLTPHLLNNPELLANVIQSQYTGLRILLTEACSDPSNVTIFTETILKK